MSADLFAAFGDEPPRKQKPQYSGPDVNPLALSFLDIDNTAQATAPQTQPQRPAFQWSQPTAPAQTVDDDDDFGEFEGESSQEPAPVKQDPFAFTSTHQIPQPSQTSWQSAPVMQDPFAFTSTSQTSQPDQTAWQPAPVVKAKKSYDSNVLFDAEEDNDDFGDFEGDTETITPAQPPPVASSGLGNLPGDLTISEPQALVTSASRKTNRSPAAKKSPIGGFGTIAKSKGPSATAPSLAKKSEDTWDSFDDWEASIPAKPKSKAGSEPKPAPTSPASTPQPSILSPAYDEPQPGELPPTNVPPPGVLLSLFPTIFTDAQNKLFKPMAAQTLPMRNKLLSEPATITFLQGYLTLTSVAARVIAGRKLRWKRDTHLSQGMRIGPASSRATSGMKLTGIDKSENMKEEREVSDLVRAWKEQVGRLRHVVSAANQARAGSLGAVPDIQETLPVKTLKQSEGGVPAPQPCMLCGLKRDERIATVDNAVDDSFGEWWVDQVNMHRGTFTLLPIIVKCWY